MFDCERNILLKDASRKMLELFKEERTDLIYFPNKLREKVVALETIEKLILAKPGDNKISNWIHHINSEVNAKRKVIDESY